MTPKLKAQDIIEFYQDRSTTIREKALYMVDQILDMPYPHNKFAELDNHLTFWNKVKDEIKKME